MKFLNQFSIFAGNDSQRTAIVDRDGERATT